MWNFMVNPDFGKVVSYPQIRYELPMSKVFQAVKKNSKIETSWNTVKEFLSSCTNANIEQPSEMCLTINMMKDKNTAILTDKANRVKVAFGTPEKHFDGLNQQLLWELNPNQLNAVIDLMIQMQPYPPPTIRTYISLRIDYYFEWVDKTTGKILDCQEYKSHLAVFLEKNSDVMPEFWFPFSNTNELSDYLNSINEFLPFRKLDTKAFRLVSPNKNKTGNVKRKLSI